jgi:siderophore synthetase component
MIRGLTGSELRMYNPELNDKVEVHNLVVAIKLQLVGSRYS